MGFAQPAKLTRAFTPVFAGYAKPTDSHCKLKLSWWVTVPMTREHCLNAPDGA